MITIKEDKPTKLPGDTSLFISFNYNKEIVNIIKANSDVYIYNPKNYVWEVPASCLANLVNNLTYYDDITISLLEDKNDNTKPRHSTIKFKTTPFDYQLDGINYGLNHDRFLLLDAPGLGKTLQIIYLAEELQLKEKLEHCFIVCGINTLKTNWKNEIQKHSTLSCRILGERKKKNGEVYIGSVKDRLEDLKNPIEEFFVITNIETLRDDDIIKELTKGKKNKFDMIVVDEIHTCKSSQSQQGKHLLKLKAKHMIGASGTLLVNNPLDSYVPLHWIEKDKSTLTNYKYYYCVYGGYFNNELLGYKNINTLKTQLEDCSLRRTKDLLNLPPKNIIHEFIDMNDDQQKFYNNIKDGIVDQVDKVTMSTVSLLAMVTRLRQATACPSVLTTENIKSSKIERAKDLVAQILSDTNNKVVIFSVFKETLNILNEELKTYNPLLCTGDVKDTIINNNIKNFQEDNVHKIILATTSKMGTGITLTRASYAIFIDCPWTSAMCLQCEDRIYRIGSNNSVFIYYLWCNDTIDTRVKEIVDTKGLLSDYIIDGTCPPDLADNLRKIITDL